MRLISLGLVPAVIAGTAAAAFPNPILVYNPSPSLPEGFYVRTSAPIVKGQIIGFRVPPLGREYATKNLPSLTKGGIIKPIAASVGDHVCTTIAHGLEINGRPIAAIAQRDRNGVALPHWRGCRRLGPGEFFVVSTRVPNSFDSRYYGPITWAEITGAYRPIWITNGIPREGRADQATHEAN